MTFETGQSSDFSLWDKDLKKNETLNKIRDVGESYLFVCKIRREISVFFHLDNYSQIRRDF